MHKPVYTYQQFGKYVSLIYEDDHAICVARHNGDNWIIMTDPPIGEIKNYLSVAPMGPDCPNNIDDYVARLNGRGPYTEEEKKLNIARRVVKHII